MKKIVLALGLAIPSALMAQGRGGQPPQSPRQAAPQDLTGNWVSVISEDYRWRMVTPLKGDAASIPYKQDARSVIDAWDPAKDEAAGLQCKAYGAPALLRLPTRLRISWQDDNTLKIESDAGTQTRLLHFGGQVPANTQPSWQGYSVARWEGPPYGTGGAGLGLAQRIGAKSQSLEVKTTNLREGYLRKNGVPYSDQTTVTEYFDRFTLPDGQEWFTVTTMVNDQKYLFRPFVTTSDFKKEPDGSKWDPSPCKAR
jgi:hypothetical protein